MTNPSWRGTMRLEAAGEQPNGRAPGRHSINKHQPKSLYTHLIMTGRVPLGHDNIIS